MNDLTQIKWNAVKDEIRTILIELARVQQTITYSELARMLQTAYVHYHSNIFFRLLIEIGQEEDRAGRPSLPALVVTKQTGMPGGGFFRYEAELGGDSSALEAYWRGELEQVFEYYAEQKAADADSNHGR